MSRFQYQLQAAQRAHDNACPCCDDDQDRDERVAERRDELFFARMADETRVKDAFEASLSNDYDDFYSSALTRFLIDFNEAQTDASMLQASYVLFRALLPNVEAPIRAEAETDAEAEELRREEAAAADATDRAVTAREMARDAA